MAPLTPKTTIVPRSNRPSLVAATVPVHGHTVSVELTEAVDGLVASDFALTVGGIVKPISHMSGGGKRWQIELMLADWVLEDEIATLSYVGESRIKQFTAAPVANSSIVSERGRALVQRKRSCSLCLSLPTFISEPIAPGTTDKNLFNPTGLASPSDLDNWIDAAQAFGAESLMLIAKHHDGFCLWPSALRPGYSVAATSPWWGAQGFDIVQAFVDRVRLAGLKVGLYISIWDRKFELDNPSPSDAAYTAFLAAQLTELLSYGPIDELLFDGWAGIVTYPPFSYPSYTKVNKTTILNVVTSLQPNCAVLMNDYNQQLLDSDINIYERGLGPTVNLPVQNNQQPSQLWMTPDDTGNSWFDDIDHRNYKSSEFFLNLIATAHARNASVMFNLSPDTTGLIDSTRIAYLASLNP